jgi:hypothetical protein
MEHLIQKKKIKVRNYFGYLGLDGRIILKKILGRTNRLLAFGKTRITQKTEILGGGAHRHIENNAIS